MMKTELTAVKAKDLQVIEYRGQRVVTTEQMATGYGAAEQMITNNFNRNKSRFVEGKHYFKLTNEDVEILRNSFRGVQISSKARTLTLWTERGAANHAKMLETDQAWSYHDDLVEFYFTNREALPVIDPLMALNDPEFLRGTLLTYTEKVLTLEHKVEEVSGERDEAIRTKGQISRKREASALGKLGAVTRRCRQLEDRLGESVKHATIIRVEKLTGKKSAYKFAPLRRWCHANGVEALNVPDERYGSVKAWPAEAWIAVYGVDLKKFVGGGV